VGFPTELFHSEMSFFAEDGTLMATAGQGGALPKER
jgi:acyl-CoA thioesterase